MIKKNGLLKLIGIIAIIMLFIIGLFTIYGSLFASMLYNALMYGKYSTMFISEIVIVIFAIIIISIRKLWPELRKKKESFLKGIKRGMPILVIAGIMFIFNMGSIIVDGNLDFANFLSLILVSLSIGIAEEFLFRGWLQNEIMRKYNNSLKEAIITIIVSGVLFGLFHMINVLSGQDILTTITQVIQTSAIGILFCSIYHASRNIWSLVFLHSFYDFSILLSEVNSYKDCINNTNVSLIVNIITLTASILFAIIYITYSYLNVKDDLKIRRRVTLIIIASVVLIFLSTSLVPSDEMLEKQTCYSYESLEIDSGKINFFVEDEFTINYVDSNNYIYNYKLFIEKHKLNITNLNTGEDIIIDIDDVNDFIIYEDNINYILLVYTNEKVYYSNYINKNNLTNFNNFNNINNSFISYDVPEVIDMGYIEIDNKLYPLLKSYINDYFVIKDNAVLVLK